MHNVKAPFSSSREFDSDLVKDQRQILKILKENVVYDFMTDFM